MSHIKKNFLSIFSSNIINLFVSIIATPIIVRILGPSKYGEYAVILSVIPVLMIITNLGMFDGIRKHIGETDDYDELTNIFNFYTQVSIVMLLLVALLLLLATLLGLVQQIFGPGFDVYFYTVSLMIGVRQFFRLTRGTLIGLDQSTYSESLLVAKNVLFHISAIALLLYYGNVISILIADVLSFGLTALVGLILVSRTINYPDIFTISSSKISWKEILRFNISTVVLVSMVVSLYHVDILLLQFFGFEEQVGYYRSALVIAEFLWFVPLAIQTSILHSVSRLWANDQINQISAMASRITRYVVTLTLLLVIGVAVLAEPLVHVYYGKAFSAAVTPMLILLPGAFGYAIVRPIYTISQSTGRLRPLIILSSIAATTNVVLNLILIPQYGTAGAAAATSIGYGSMLILHIIGSRWIGFNPLKQIYPIRLLVTGGVSLTVIYSVYNVISGDIVSLLVVPPIGFVV